MAKRKLIGYSVNIPYNSRQYSSLYSDEIEGAEIYMEMYMETGDWRFKMMANDEKRHAKMLRSMM